MSPSVERNSGHRQGAARHWRLILITVFFCLLFGITSSAEETTGYGETVPTEFSDFLSALPEEIREFLPPALFEPETEGIGEAVTQMSTPSFLFRAVTDALGLHFSDALRALAATVGLLLLSGIFSALRASLRSESVGKAFSFAVSLAILSAITVQGYTCVESVTDYLNRLCSITDTAIPLLGVLYAMGGNLTVSAVSSAGLTAYMTVLENTVGKTVVPFCGLCLALSLMSASEFGIRTGTLLATVKKKYTTLLSFLMMLLLAMLAAQSTLGTGADTLAMRSVRFAAGNLIPAVGGSVGELLRTVSAGVGYLRGSVGICGVLLLVLTMLPTLAELLLYRTVWQIGASVADLLGCDGEKRVLEEIASLNGYLTAAVCICSSVLLLAMTLLAHCASAIGA